MVVIITFTRRQRRPRLRYLALPREFGELVVFHFENLLVEVLHFLVSLHDKLLERTNLHLLILNNGHLLLIVFVVGHARYGVDTAHVRRCRFIFILAIQLLDKFNNLVFEAHVGLLEDSLVLVVDLGFTFGLDGVVRCLVLKLVQRRVIFVIEVIV